MAIAKGFLKVIDFFMIIELIATYPRVHYVGKANVHIKYSISKSEADELITPVMKTKRNSYSEITPWLSTIHSQNNLSVEKDLDETNGLQHISNPNEQMLIIYTKAFIRDSLKVIQNKLKSATATESTELLDILLKIKNLSKADEKLVTKALYHTMEVMNEVNADLTFSGSNLNWAEMILVHFELVLEKQRLGALKSDIYESLNIVNDIERNFDAVRLFWLKL